MIPNYFENIQNTLTEEMYKVSWLVKNEWGFCFGYWFKEGFIKQYSEDSWCLRFSYEYCDNIQDLQKYTTAEAYKIQNEYFKQQKLEKYIEDKKQLLFPFIEE